ncbi:MAG: cobalamin B12-binding domain-containing protein [Deltaproteobacteria bacterium]|nr:cobalamin B12-binding domain-containing protein [Deltaproteobacteria bacterium]
MSRERIRVLIAKPGLDGHDVGAKVVAHALRDAGMDVLYTGLRQQPEQIARAAADEDVDVVGLSILSGAHLPLCASVARALEAERAEGLLLMVGGVIPERDQTALSELGFRGVFPVGSKLGAIADFVRENVR